MQRVSFVLNTVVGVISTIRLARPSPNNIDIIIIFFSFCFWATNELLVRCRLTAWSRNTEAPLIGPGPASEVYLLGRITGRSVTAFLFASEVP